MIRKIQLVLLLSFICIHGISQYAQPLRGVVIDPILQKALSGATVTVRETGQTMLTDESGSFRFANLPLGSYSIQISFMGFRELLLENISLTAGKETVLTIPMESQVVTQQNVTVRSTSRKNRPVNDMSAVSARAFTVEETQKYAASVNDPLRMATAFPGVLAADDGNNSIIIRGNSPAGLLWKMEGIDIPNPNHFSNAGASGGGISILSAQLLANSDFLLGAFAAEYGNALSGVFDLHLRKGNNEKREYTLQAGVLGLNAAVEGPFSKKYKGSYLINYRYSTLEILNKTGILPDEASTNFQDLSYHFYLPTNGWGNFSVFGFAGKSSDVTRVEMDSSKWSEKSDRYRSDFISKTQMTGLTHSVGIGEKANLKSAVGYSRTSNSYDEDFVEDDYSLRKNFTDNYQTVKWNLSSTLNYKFSNRLQLRAGIIGQLIHFDYFQRSREEEDAPLLERIKVKGNTQTQQAFFQWQYRSSGKLTFNAGLHLLRLSLNQSQSVEPRLSAKWAISQNSSLAFGYGLHSQLQAMGVYFAQVTEPNGSLRFPNKNLDFTRSHHYVLSFQQRLTDRLVLKAEGYYQQLTDVPVGTEPGSTFSTLNIVDDFVVESLANSGKGRNYGVELSLERYLRNHFYFTLSNSLYQSKYTAADGVERNTRFNGNHISTFIAGKDFVRKNGGKMIGVNIKTIYAGGLRTTPIDRQASTEKGYTVFDEQQAFTLQNPAYFRADLRLSLQWNRKNRTSTLSLDIQNLTNRLNVSNQRYDEEKQTVVNTYQTGLIPILNYKLEF